MSRPYSLLSAALIALLFWSGSTAQTSPVVAIRASPGNWSQLAKLTPPAFSSSLSQNLVGIS